VPKGLGGGTVVVAVEGNGQLLASRTKHAVVNDIVTSRRAGNCRDESKWETVELWGTLLEFRVPVSHSSNRYSVCWDPLQTLNDT